MSWSTGSCLMSDIISDLAFIDDDELRKEVFKILINNFENYDCDSLYECEGEDPMFDAAFKENSLLSKEEESDDIYLDEEDDPLEEFEE